MENKYNGYTNYITWKVAHELIDPYTFADLEEGPEVEDIKYHLLEEFNLQLSRIRNEDQALAEIFDYFVKEGMRKINFEELKEVYTL